MDNKEDLSLADLMSALMMVFLLIAIVFMLDTEKQKMQLKEQNDAMADIVLVAQHSQSELHKDLQQEFSVDLAEWQAVILKDNTVRFTAPNVLFASGESTLTAHFKTILNSFFPRYIKILHNYHQDIEAIRIEGHTSSPWNNIQDMTLRYLKNAKLSQQRALSTLSYCYQLDAIQHKQLWLQKVFRANGLSFAQRIFNADGTENMAKSRRVEFKVVTKAEEKLHQILEQVESNKKEQH